jgi:2-amino-4-hydroxy-6-hydroxymethyldihydropteridine diphosphokinase
VILVAIGGNLPGPWGERPVDACRRAAHELGRLPGLRVEAVSRWYRSAPVPRADQPDYANGVVRLTGTAEPADLLARLQAIEQAAGRVRGVRNAARTLDMDIIDIDGLVRDSPDPRLPHPRAHERAFVLLPVRDVAPEWIEPRSGRNVAALLANLREGCGAAPGQIEWPTPYR